ncbi:MAG: hypothetical protein JNK04_04645, partial [Myxococcales bacterium]|nr:hypothetical protein [Myxococcales bacterium]
MSAGFAVHIDTALGRTDTDGGCPIPGDSGGPVFFNFTALGGTAFPSGELLATDVLIAGVDSSGAADPTNGTPDPSDDYTTCPGLSPSRYTASWDFNYTLTSPSGVAKSVAGNNGTFIGARLKDFDGDGVFDVDDNCVVAPNPDQANCNADAETAKGYPRRGDACDPIPCPASDARDAVTTLLSSTNNGNGFATKTIKAIRDQIDVKPLASSFYGNGAGQARLRPSVDVGSVTTKYRYCQPDSAFLVNCGASAIDDSFADTAEGTPSPTRPYHKARMIPNPGSGSGQDNEALAYTPGAAVAPRRWKYLDDYNLWSSSGWITPTFGCSIITGQCYTNLNGRFWSHAATTKGRFNDQVNAPPGDDGWAPFTTGYRVNNLGNASSAASENGSHLANNYIMLEPDAEKTSIAFTTSNQIVTYLPWWCDITPKWDGVVGERSPLIAAGTSYAIMLRDGTAQVVDSYMTSSARTLLASTSRVAAGAEVMREQGFGGFQAVTFSSTGTNLTNVLGTTTNNVLGAGSDLSFSVSTTTGPASRTGFTPVYSRYDDLAFVVGGTLVGGGDAGDIWMRQVKGTLGWTNITPSGLGLKKVLAATYSFRDGTLWVLDENSSANTRRLIRVS